MNLPQAYLALVLLATPLGSPLTTIFAYWALAGGIFMALSSKKSENEEKTVIPDAMLGIPIAILIISRALPIMRWGGIMGLGADSAAYYLNFNRCLETFASCAATPIALFAYPSSAIGMGPETALITLALCAQAGLAAMLYVAAKEYSSRNAAFWSLMAFALSLPQFLTYWSFFLNMEIAMAFTLCAMVAYQRRSPYAALWATAAGIIHFVTFVPLAITLLGLVIIDKEKQRYGMMILGISLLGTLIYQFPAIAGYAENAASYAVGTYGREKALFLAGHFVNFSFYHSALMLFYLPFALYALAQGIRSEKLSFMGIYALVTIALVALNSIFHNRFILLFDIAAIMLAGETIKIFYGILLRNRVSKACGYLLFLALAGYTLYESARMEPLMDKREFAEVKALAGRYGALPIFVNSPTYRQFLEGYGGHPAIASSFAREPWRTGKTEALIYNARRSGAFEPHGDPRYGKISDRVWKYEP